MAHLIITKIEPSDWDEIIASHFRAFIHEPYQQLIHGKDTSRNRQIFKEQSLNKYTTLGNSIWLKAVDTNNNSKIVGVVNYTLNPTYVPLKRVELNSDDMIWLEDPEDKRILGTMSKDIVDRKLRLVKEGHIREFPLSIAPPAAPFPFNFPSLLHIYMHTYMPILFMRRSCPGTDLLDELFILGYLPASHKHSIWSIFNIDMV